MTGFINSPGGIQGIKLDTGTVYTKSRREVEFQDNDKTIGTGGDGPATCQLVFDCQNSLGVLLEFDVVQYPTGCWLGWGWCAAATGWSPSDFADRPPQVLRGSRPSANSEWHWNHRRDDICSLLLTKKKVTRQIRKIHF
jgi:hypothetical protein